ncbi:hypothetical protein JTB14_020063 [Gonioctena quinquepunctata]|nr:hypothetical protein JTB14_020063 [Gonioctena quinquepunctata]
MNSIPLNELLPLDADSWSKDDNSHENSEENVEVEDHLDEDISQQCNLSANDNSHAEPRYAKRQRTTKAYPDFMLYQTICDSVSKPQSMTEAFSGEHCRKWYESPPVAGILENDIFVDDVVSGSHSLPEALKLQTDLIRILDRVVLNYASGRATVPNCLSFTSFLFTVTTLGLDLEPDSVIKILGLQWNPVSDSFTYEVKPLNKPCTKRSILSELARIYDPLGFLSPVVLFIKNLIQILWTIGIDWDSAPLKA